jgi:hypothetical protein
VTKHHVTDHVTKDETTTEDWAVSAGALTFEGRVYVPDSDELRPKVITSTMIIPNQATRHTRHGVNMPIEPPSQPWKA